MWPARFCHNVFEDFQRATRVPGARADPGKTTEDSQTVEDLMGSRINALKLVSSLTLFRAGAESPADKANFRPGDTVLRFPAEGRRLGSVWAVRLHARGYIGQTCVFTDRTANISSCKLLRSSVDRHGGGG